MEEDVNHEEKGLSKEQVDKSVDISPENTSSEEGGMKDNGSRKGSLSEFITSGSGSGSGLGSRSGSGTGTEPSDSEATKTSETPEGSDFSVGQNREAA